MSPRVGEAAPQAAQDWSCAFCGKPVHESLKNGSIRVQVVFDGVKGNFIQKRPGKALAFHNVCELPPELESK